MALNAGKIQNTNNNRKPAEALDEGTYPARLVQILSLGLQKQRPYKGEEKAPQQELYLTYELLDEFMEDEDGNILEDKPRWISETIPLHSIKADLAKSTKRYTALDPALEYGGDWSQLAGTPCTVVLGTYVSPRDNVKRNKVLGISAMRAKDAAKAPELVNPAKVFDIDDPDMEVFGSLPEWLQDKMKENLEYAGSPLQKAVQGGKATSGTKVAKEEKTPQKAAQSISDDEEEDEEDW